MDANSITNRVVKTHLLNFLDTFCLVPQDTLVQRADVEVHP